MKYYLKGFLKIYVILLSIAIFLFCNFSMASSPQEQFAQLELTSGGHLGVFAMDTGNHKWIAYHANKRFPMCSTAKLMVVSAILKQNIKSQSFLNQKLMITKKDIAIAGYTPVTQKYINHTMTILALARAAMTKSDNAAMNILLKKLHGPARVTAFARSIGDSTFRLDRMEPALNSAIPGDIRDTTTPKAMAKSLQRLTLGSVLALPQRHLLISWLKANTTGNARIRAGVPVSWSVGDKTGTGYYGTTNDIGILWPPTGSPIIVAIYFTQNKENARPRDDVIAVVTGIIVRRFMK